MRRLPYIGVCVAGLLVSGCHAGLLDDGEFTRSQCSDGADNDMDQAIDCEEASCRVFDTCREQVEAGADAAADGGSRDATAADADVRDAQMDAARVDAATDAGIDVQPDGGLCRGSTQPCADAGVCFRDMCVRPFPAIYAIRALSAVVTRSRPAMDGSEDCFDPLTGCDLIGECGCAWPEPFVRVLIDGAPQDQTTVRRRTLMPDWSEGEENLLVEIDSSDTMITLQVRDDDAFPGDDIRNPDDELMFECPPFRVDVDTLPTPLTCSTELGETMVELEASLHFVEPL